MGKNMTTKTLLDYIAVSATAHSEEDESLLLKLMQPTEDREEMGDLYSNLLGYNPITYFDEKYLHQIYADVVRKAPSNIKIILEANEDEFIQKTMIRLDRFRDDYLINLLAKVISEETGWINPDLSYEEDDDENSIDSPVQELEDENGGEEDLNEYDDADDDDENDGFPSNENGDD